MNGRSWAMAAALLALAVPAMTDEPVPAAGATRVRAADGMVMVYVPAGEFSMGSAAGERGSQSNEKPQHVVYLDAYWVDRTEVTTAQFRRFVQATGYVTAAERQGWAYAWVESAKSWQEVRGADWRHPFGPGSEARDDHPVVQVSWTDAAAYCAWAGAALPTEAQWEKAARGTDGRLYPWGNEFDGTRVNYGDSVYGGDSIDGFRFTAPVGSYPQGASPYGALDMAGNVWEWTADRYGAGYYASSPQRNPAGPERGGSRVLRGGSWNHESSGMRSAYRLEAPGTTLVDNFGFRCVAPAGD